MAAARRTPAPKKSAPKVGGIHPDSAVLKDLLRLSDIVDSRTKKPLSEAVCFGIAGGIAAGYTYVPEFLGAGVGSGISFVGRHRQFLPDARWQTEFLRRLEIRCLAIEQPDPQRAFDNLAAGMQADRPLIAWCSPVLFPQMSFAATGGMYTVLVQALNLKKKRVVLSDNGPDTFEMSIDDFTNIRGRVNPLGNRVLVIDPPAKLEHEKVAAAVIAGIKACLFGSRDLDQRGRRPVSIRECAGFLSQHHHSFGWKNLFPEGRLYLALADTYETIEVAGNGGGFFRGLFADFLDEAAVILERKALTACAKRYRMLAGKWTELADIALPKKYAAFQRAREALQKIDKAYRTKGHGADAEIAKQRQVLAEVEKSVQSRFPLDGHQVNRLLDEISVRLLELADGEDEAAAQLRHLMR